MKIDNLVKINKSNYGISYILVCLNCKKKFKVGKMSYDKGRYKNFCSLKCRSEFGRKNVKCLTCSKTFSVRKSQKAKYCSRECARIVNKRKKSIEHKDKIAKSHTGMKATKQTRKKLSKNKIEYFKRYPERHLNRIMARKDFISEPQKEMFRIIKKVYSKAELEYPIKTDEGMKYIDVAIPKLKIACEYDGAYWHKNKKKDLKRQRAIERKNWKVLRFNKHNLDKCLDRIKNVYKL